MGYIERIWSTILVSQTDSRQLFTVGIMIILCGCCILPILSENVAADTWIYISSPNGGSYFVGELLTINWDPSGAGSYVKIELYHGSDYLTIASYVNNDGSYSYSIPESYSPSSSYRIKVASTYNSSIFGFSNYFTISGQSITIISPSGGETLFIGDTYTISWQSENVGDYVKIGYEIDYYQYEITPSTYDDGSYEWSIEFDLGQQCRIYVTSLSYNHISDYGEYFTIDERYTNVNSPYGGERWYREETYTITWDSKNAGEYVAIELYTGGSYYSTITSNTVNDGSYSWTIPPNVDTKSNYNIRIQSVAFDSVYGSSGYFTIDERTVFIGSPSGGETWFLGETYPIYWESDNAGRFVNIELYEDGEYFFTIVSGTENNGRYYWTVPENFNSGSQYSIKITSTYYDDVYEYSSGYVAIEEDWMEHLFGIITLILILLIISIVIAVLIKKKKIRIPTLRTPRKNIAKKKDLVDSEQINQEETINQEKYEQIWEGR